MEIVVGEDNAILHLAILVKPEDGLADMSSRELMEGLEVEGSYLTPNLGSDGGASITNEIFHVEDLDCRLDVICLEEELPVVGELERKPRVVTGFYLEDIREEIGTKTNMEGLDDTGSLRLSSREVDDSELFIWLQLNQIWPEDDSRLFALVVVDLNS